MESQAKRRRIYRKHEMEYIPLTTQRKESDTIRVMFYTWLFLIVPMVIIYIHNQRPDAAELIYNSIRSFVAKRTSGSDVGE